MTAVTCVIMTTVTCHNDHGDTQIQMSQRTLQYFQATVSLCALHAPLRTRCSTSERRVKLPWIRTDTGLGGGRALCKHLWKVGRGDGVIWGHMGTGTSWCQHNSMARLAELPTLYTQSAPYHQLAAVNSVFISCILILSLLINVNHAKDFYRLYTPTRICSSANTCYIPCPSHPSWFQ